jgi:hypothetical protein
MAIGLVLRGYDIVVHLFQERDVVSRDQVVRDDRGLALLFRCRASDLVSLGSGKGGSCNGRRRQHDCFGTLGDIRLHFSVWGSVVVF